jgi:hypothetical protein
MSEKVIYLAYSTPDLEQFREDLMFTLFKAGFKVIPLGKIPKDEEEYKAEVKTCLSKSNCSIHLIGSSSGDKLPSENNISRPEFEYKKAQELTAGKNNFKIFVWHPQSAIEASSDDKQNEFINDVQNNVAANMTYTTTPSVIQLADDIRSMIDVIDKPNLQLNKVDIFLINNIMDDGTADEIIDMLSDVAQIEKLTVSSKEEKDFAEITSQQIPLSRLAVVYFKDSADWAIPFAQQIWKNVGGAATQTPILVIGDQNPETNKEKKFKAPQVISMIVQGELIPLEIKVQFDKIVETNT